MRAVACSMQHAAVACSGVRREGNGFNIQPRFQQQKQESVFEFVRGFERTFAPFVRCTVVYPPPAVHTLSSRGYLWPFLLCYSAVVELLERANMRLPTSVCSIISVFNFNFGLYSIVSYHIPLSTVREVEIYHLPWAGSREPWAQLSVSPVYPVILLGWSQFFYGPKNYCKKRQENYT